MEKFYSWRGIFQKVMKRDYYWWKDDENREYVEYLKNQLYAETGRSGR